MNLMTFWNPGDQALLLAANVLIQVSVVTGIALTIVVAARRHPAARYGVLWTTLMLVLLSPVLALVLQTSGRGLLPVSLMVADSSDDAPPVQTVAGGEPARVPSASPEPKELLSPPRAVLENSVGTFDPVEVDSFSEPPVSIDFMSSAPPLESYPTSEELNASESYSLQATTPAGKALRAAMPPVLSIWIVGAVVLLVRMSIAWWRLVALVRAAGPVRNRSSLAILEEVCQDLGLKRAPALVQSAHVTGPVSTGLLRPRVLLPEWMAERVTDEQLRAILIHEAAHILRRDQVTVLLQNISMAVFWLHPLVRVLNRRLALAREEICDNYVLAANDAPSYSRTLLALAQSIQTPRPLPGTVGLFTSRWKLDRRVADLLDESRNRMTSLTIPGRACIAALAAILLAVATSGTMTLAVGPAGDPMSDPTKVRGAHDDGQVIAATADDPAASPTTDETPAITADTPMVVVTGIVLDDGEPVAGATVQAWFQGFTGNGWPPTTTEKVATDSGGRFVIPMPRRRLVSINVIAQSPDGARMAVSSIPGADNYGADVRSWLEDPLRLPDFELGLTPSISREIHVVDSAGAPIEAAHVGLYLYSSWDFADASTDTNGAVVMRVPAGCEYYEFFAWKPGFALDYAFGGDAWREQRMIPGDADSPITLTLGDAAGLPVRVVNSITGQSLPGVAVRAEVPAMHSEGASYAGSALGYDLSVVTGSNGVAAIDWLPAWITSGRPPEFVREESFRVSARCPGYVDEQTQFQFKDSNDLLTLRMIPEYRLQGRVVQADGSPAAGIVVASWRDENGPFDQTVTDDDGRYELAAPPDLGTVVSVINDKWAAVPRTEFDILRPLELAYVADMVLEPAKRVFGRVTAADDDRPVAGQQISLESFGPAAGPGNRSAKAHATFTTRTDVAGRYEFHVGPGDYDIVAPKELESADSVLFARGYAHRSLNVPETAESCEQNFELSIWKDGEKSDRSSNHERSENDANAGRSNQVAAANAPGRNVDHRVVTGHAVDDNGNAVGGATVVLPIDFGFAGQPRNVAQGVTNADGLFRLEVPVEWLEPPIWHHLWSLWIYKPGFALGTANVLQQLKVSEPGNAAEVLLTAESTPTFTILDETGEVARNVRVEPQHYRTPVGGDIVPQEILPHLAGETDKDGRITMHCMQKGKLLDLLVRSDRHGTQEFRVDGLPDGGELRLREAVPLKGRVIGDDPAWSRNIALYFTTESGHRGGFTDAVGSAEVTTDADGRFEIPRIATGSLRVEEALDPKLPVRLRIPEDMAVPVEGELVLQFEPAKFVHGRVVRKDDQSPVAGVEVSVRYGQFRQGERAVTDENGEFEARVLAGEVYQQVIAIPDPDLTSVGAAGSQRFEVPSSARDFELPLIELVGTYRQTGQLVDADGKPLANYNVWGVNGNRRYGFAKTNDRGEFEMRLPNGIDIERYGYNSTNDELGRASVLDSVPLRLRAEPALRRK